MTGHIVREGRHQCGKPEREHAPGTVWMCDECDRQYRWWRHAGWVRLWRRIPPYVVKRGAR